MSMLVAPARPVQRENGFARSTDPYAELETRAARTLPAVPAVPAESASRLGDADDPYETQDDPAGILVLGLKAPSDAPVIGHVNQILENAVREEASDIHIEAHREGLVVRYR